ncbi:unnamed protein product [Soboliphyme baturini]|uniref:OAR domain-containing protein n=1 Tax=Soboliphyme baturini TaxID=241478 RepID=A0A183IWN6_9BILA|nr:unnamed protein product [Soboliphyme baturini]
MNVSELGAAARNSLSRSPVSNGGSDGGGGGGGGDFRNHMSSSQHATAYHILNGRMSPSSSTPIGFASVTYATLTPLQPLPPISTVTQNDKFNVAGAAGFAFVGQNSLNEFVAAAAVPGSQSGGGGDGVGGGYSLNLKYDYDVKPPTAATTIRLSNMSRYHMPSTGSQGQQDFNSYHYGPLCQGLHLPPHSSSPVMVTVQSVNVNNGAPGGRQSMTTSGGGVVDQLSTGAAASQQTTRDQGGKAPASKAAAYHHSTSHTHSQPSSNGEPEFQRMSALRLAGNHIRLLMRTLDLLKTLKRSNAVHVRSIYKFRSLGRRLPAYHLPCTTFITVPVYRFCTITRVRSASGNESKGTHVQSRKAIALLSLDGVGDL